MIAWLSAKLTATIVSDCYLGEVGARNGRSDIGPGKRGSAKVSELGRISFVLLGATSERALTLTLICIKQFCMSNANFSSILLSLTRPVP